MSLWLFFGEQETISRFHMHPLGKYLDDYASDGTHTISMGPRF